MTRSYPDLTDGSTFHFITDLHLGDTFFSPQWMDRITDDLKHLRSSHVAHILGGDQVDNNRSDQYALYKAMRSTIKDTDGLPWLEVPGNHDMGAPVGHAGDVVQSKEDWADLMGLADANQTLDAGGMRFIGLAPDYWHWMDQCVLSPETLNYLDWALTTAEGAPCWIVTHGPPNGQYIGYSNYAIPSPTADLESIVSGHNNVAGWLSGHRHMEPGAPESARVMPIGGKQIFAINGPTAGGIGNDPARPNGDASPWASLSYSLLITYLGNRCVIRFRDHRSYGWARDPIILTREG
ncbi:hypothetical protein PGC08_14040 [Brevibacterium sp. BDJS002]|uniref:metallophosphoesterase family protein n=1 Tax=Brevibacterium sp. BDJS002 TaxID=3020906 RepID=UPI0023074723|nr:metallophosphoesterase [Brevibacterium sp. BDJS002]WCE39111.1 hypothetical protein PGC08_14040 [Brevibacterium sp. BDJS002]